MTDRAVGGDQHAVINLDTRIGDVYLPAEAVAERVADLGSEIASDYAGREPLLVAALKSAIVFLSDLSRALPILHHVDFVELAPYDGGARANGTAIRLLKDLDAEIEGRDVLIVEDVVDTGLTLRYLVKTLELRGPRSVSAVTLLDRPYRRLVENLPMRYVGFVVTDDFFVGYGFDLEEKYRNLPDVYLVRSA